MLILSLFISYIDKMKDKLYEFKARVVKRKTKLPTYAQSLKDQRISLLDSFMQLKPFDLTAI